MSYILEALRKAEQQRELGRVPGITSAHEQARGRDHRRWPWVLAFGLALNAAVLLVLFWPDQRPEAEADAAGALPPAAPQATPERRTALPDPLAERPVGVATGSAVSPHSVVPAEEPAERRSEALRTSMPPGDSTAVQDQMRRPRHDHEPDPAAKPSPTSPPMPVWPQIPSHLLQQLSGGLHLDVHVYADQPPDRFVLINLKKYHEGERLQEGPRLDEITTDGVILSFQGERFRVQAQH